MKKKKQPSRKRSIVLLSILCVLIVAFGVLAFVPFSYDEDGYRSYTSFAGAIELGIDLEGGTYAVLTPVYDEDNEDQTVEEQEQAFLDSLDASDGVLSVLQYRLTQLGYPEATVARQTDSYGEPSIRVEIPRNLNEGQKEALRKFAEAMGELPPSEGEEESHSVFHRRKKK